MTDGGGLLAVEDLRVEIPTRRGVVHAVRGVSFGVRAGETFALVGESGSGKTMTCRAIVRLVHPPGRITGGRVVFQGRDLVPLPERELERVRGRGMVMVFQDPMTALNPVLSVERQITEVLPDGGSRRARAVALLQQVGIPDPERRLDAYPHQLSGGQRQRVMLAIALARQPRLLVADEPTTALDVTIQAQILRLIVGLQKALGMALILVTHDLGVVYQAVTGSPSCTPARWWSWRRRPSCSRDPAIRTRSASSRRSEPRPEPAAGAHPGVAARPGRGRPGLPVRAALRVGVGGVPAGRHPAPAGRRRPLESLHQGGAPGRWLSPSSRSGTSSSTSRSAAPCSTSRGGGRRRPCAR